jgi:Tfp pilus assembly protein PilO
LGKLIKNIHWIIIGYALYGMGMFAYDQEGVVSEIHAKQEAQKQDLEKAKKSKKEIDTFKRNIDDAKSRIERVAKEIEKTQQLLPSEVSDTENISLLRKMSEDINIKEVSILPDKDDNRGFYIARRYKFKAKATYLQFLIMFEKISENKRILNISELIYQKLDQSQRSKFQLINGEFVLEAYRYNVDYKEDRSVDIEGETKAKEGEKKPRKNRKPKKKEGSEEA